MNDLETPNGLLAQFDAAYSKVLPTVKETSMARLRTLTAEFRQCAPSWTNVPIRKFGRSSP
ncbi:MAG: hypothetical protein IPG56_03045 [Caulobacteraceae bacterium]|nr:hypothetical protein [Caulobacteraceae bacterium]